MKTSNSILAKAINEADTVKAAALKNASEVLLEAFRPQIKKQIRQFSEQLNLDSPTPSNFDQDANGAGVPNIEDDINQGGAGVPVLEQDDEFVDDEIIEQEDDLEDPEEIVETDEEETDDEEEKDDEDDEDDKKEKSVKEQYEDEDDEIIEIDDELEDEEMMEQDFEDDEDIIEQDDLDDELDDEVMEQDLNFDDEEMIEQDDFSDDDEIIEIEDEDEDDEIMEQFEDDEESVDTNVSFDSSMKQAANESFTKVRRLRNENLKLKRGIGILRKKLAEVNLFNQKLAYSMKTINKRPNISRAQKRSIIEQFDNCKNLREVKLTFNTINKTFHQKQKPVLKKGRISESVKRTLNNVRNAKLNSTGSSTNRMLKLAGISE